MEAVAQRVSSNGLWPQTLSLPDDLLAIGYLAGIVDGEGTILHTPQNLWHVRVAMTDERVIDWLASYGGKKNVKKVLSGRKPAWAWNVSRQRDVYVLLVAIAPYLIAKRDRALEALAAIRLRQEG